MNCVPSVLWRMEGTPGMVMKNEKKEKGETRGKREGKRFRKFSGNRRNGTDC